MKAKYTALTLLGLSPVCHCNVSSQNSAGTRPNIIFIMSDDHAWQAISAYGGSLRNYAPTPNIDRLALNGMRFNRCLVTNSISGPSRATILTGKYSHLNGFYTNERQSPFDGSQQTFPRLLQNTGYNTAIIGKWHLMSDPTGFNHWDILPGQGFYYNPDFINSNGRYQEKGYVTDIITEKCLEWLNEAMKGEKPFMLMMHHKAPHREWQPGPEELGLFKNMNFPEPPTLFDDYSGRGLAEKSQDMSISKTMRLEEDLKLYPDWKGIKNSGLSRLSEAQRTKWDSAYAPIIREFYRANPEDSELVRYKYNRYLQDYLACIAGVDKSVGKILDFLRDNGLDKNTIVIYTSDQGFYLGEHGWFDKRWMFEESYRTPLLIQWPGVTAPGAVNSDMVSNLDFAQTILEMAGLKNPDGMQGKSFVPLLKGKAGIKWRKEHYYHYYEFPGSHSVKKHYGISTGRYKLIHFYADIDDWELFDLKEDPMELRDVYDMPEYQHIRTSLHRRLKKLIKIYNDSGAMTEELK